VRASSFRSGSTGWTRTSAHAGDSEVYLHIIAPNRARHVSRSRRYRVAEGATIARCSSGSRIQVRWRTGWHDELPDFEKPVLELEEKIES
jgi:hypothetical protein